MLVDPRLSGYLSRALSHEMAAVQQYRTQAALCELWGLADVAEKLRHEAIEELKHVEDLVSFMLQLGLLPKGTQLPPVRPARTLRDILLQDWQLEVDAIRLYDEACRYSERTRHVDAHRLFSILLKEEREHLAWIEEWLASLTEREGSDA